jgi:3-polyprenyl-4-hydroxybenzoate decarboxylase
MQQAADAGAVIFPVVPTFYAGHQTLDEILTDLAGRILLSMGIENNAYSRWEGDGKVAPDIL